MENKLGIMLLVYATVLTLGALAMAFPVNAFYKKYRNKDISYYFYLVFTGHTPSIIQLNKFQKALVILSVVMAYTSFLLALLIITKCGN